MATLTRGSSALFDDSRYRYDERICSHAKGWAQLDSRQDASYFEGDLTHTECSDEADFIQALTETINWNKEAGYWIGIDPGWPGTAKCDEIRSAFVVLGFRDALH